MNGFWPSITMVRRNKDWGSLAAIVPVPFRPDRIAIHGIDWIAERIVNDACLRFDCRPRDLEILSYSLGDEAAWKR